MTGCGCYCGSGLCGCRCCEASRGEQFGRENVSCGIVLETSFFHFPDEAFEFDAIRGAGIQKPLELVQFARILTERRSVGAPHSVVRFHNHQTICTPKGFAISG